MSYGGITIKRLQICFVKNFHNQAAVLDSVNLMTIRRRDTCCFLTTVLQGMERKVSELGSFFVTKNSNNGTFFIHIFAQILSLVNRGLIIDKIIPLFPII